MAIDRDEGVDYLNLHINNEDRIKAVAMADGVNGAGARATGVDIHAFMDSGDGHKSMTPPFYAPHPAADVDDVFLGYGYGSTILQGYLNNGEAGVISAESHATSESDNFYDPGRYLPGS